MLDETERAIEWDAGQRRPELERAESLEARLLFAVRKEPCPQSAPGVCGMHEECADARGLGCGIEERVGRAFELIATVKRPSPAPAAARSP